ncbi:helix-turn-helix domain-containing protein [Sphingobium sp. AN641]|uniref:TetR/AcrR family transcriptional regulator n=1 Tax=Sphingobium sp. AN641 TaxID=3133443 RepID=UPI0030C301E4
MSRKTQILDAARACVIAEGVHAATISRICAQASMSVGHVYKIFASKEAIMIALTERDFEDFMLHITHPDELGKLDIDALVDRYLNAVPWLLDFERAALAQAVLAEAARNPRVAELVARVDDRFRDALRTIVAPAFEGLAERDINGRIETLLMMTRALALHASTHPASAPDMIAAGFEVALRALLSPASLAASCNRA